MDQPCQSQRKFASNFKSRPSVTIRVGQREPVFQVIRNNQGGTVGKSVNIHHNQLGCVRTRAVGHSRSSADIARATVELTGSRGISSRLAAESWHMERQTPGRPSKYLHGQIMGLVA